MIVNPELSPYILKDGISGIVYYGTVFAKQQIFAIKYVLINIVHKRCCTVIRITPLFHLRPLCARKRYALAIVNLHDLTNSTDAPANR